jgi:hypothetical protein
MITTAVRAKAARNIGWSSLLRLDAAPDGAAL